MARTVTQIRCPNCQTPIQAEIEQVVDVAEDPSAKSRLLSGGLNYVQCPHCGYQGQLATPLVYHDPEKELLLTFMPAEIGLNKDDQERLIGRLINQIVDRLPQEARKGYLLQPKSSLTLRGMAEQILEADGVTKEDIEDQQEKLRLFQQLMRTSDDELESFVEAHEEDLTEDFFQLASFALQTAGDETSVQAAAEKLNQALRLSGVGKRLEAQVAEIREAAEIIESLGEDFTQEKLLQLLVEAPSDERVAALANLTRPAIDYGFFQELSERIDKAEGEQRSKLEALRSKLVEITQQIDEAQKARAMQAARLLQSLIQADDLDAALESALPAIDDLFLETLRANLSAAKEQDEKETVAKLEQIQSKVLPPSLELAQRVFDIHDTDAAKKVLSDEAEKIDYELLATLLDAVGQLQQRGAEEDAQRIMELHRHAMGLSMRKNLRSKDAPS
jgi:hypothetical protein